MRRYPTDINYASFFIGFPKLLQLLTLQRKLFGVGYFTRELIAICWCLRHICTASTGSRSTRSEKQDDCKKLDNGFTAVLHRRRKEGFYKLPLHSQNGKQLSHCLFSLLITPSAILSRSNPQRAVSSSSSSRVGDQLARFGKVSGRSMSFLSFVLYRFMLLLLLLDKLAGCLLSPQMSTGCCIR